MRDLWLRRSIFLFKLHESCKIIVIGSLKINDFVVLKWALVQNYLLGHLFVSPSRKLLQKSALITILAVEIRRRMALKMKLFSHSYSLCSHLYKGRNKHLNRSTKT